MAGSANHVYSLIQSPQQKMKRALRGFTSIPTDLDLAARAVLHCLSNRRQRRLQLRLPDHWIPEIGPVSPDLLEQGEHA